jgi:hypothetical protein
MRYTLPIRVAQSIIDRTSHPVLITGVVTLALLLGLYMVTGSIYPTDGQRGFQDPLEATGLFLLFSTLPAYLLGGLVAQVRANTAIVDALSEILDAGHHAVLHRMDQVRYWHLGVLAGFVYAAAANIPWSSLTFQPGNPGFIFSLTLLFAHFVTWGVVGLALAVAEHNAFVLFRVGKLVQVDLFNLDRLNPFGQSSLRGVLLVVGALALMPLQALDQEFRWANYQNGILVGIPAILLLILLPNWTVHKKIRRVKVQALQELDAEIAAAPRTLDNEALTRLNALLERRNRITHLRNWPIDFSLLTRVVFYVLIPPLAWAGAALVELALDSYLSG